MSSDDEPPTAAPQEQDILDFEQIVGAPLSAIVAAQAHAAAATYDFLNKLTDPDPEDPSARTLKKLNFVYDRINIDPEKGETVQRQTLGVPLMTVIPIPYLSIGEAEINFNARIVYHEEQENKQERGFFGKLVKLRASYAPSSRSSADTLSDIEVKIKIKQEIPEGLSKTLSIFSNAITVK